MTAYKIPHSGAWTISAIIGNRLVSRTYYDYTKREAMAEFKAETRGMQ